MKLHDLDYEDGRYSVRTMPGVAFWLDRPETEQYDYNEDGSYEETETGMVLAVMVGDDRRHVVDPDDLVLIADEDYCSSCGQIGCEHGWTGVREDWDANA